MQINIKTSEKNQKVIQTLTRKLPDGTKENVIARIAFAFSICKGRKFAESEFNLYDSKGKDFKDHILFDEENHDFYVALVCQHYNIYKTDENIPKYVKLHIDEGLERLEQIVENTPNFDFIDFLAENLQNEIAHLETPSQYGFSPNRNQKAEKLSFAQAIDLPIGTKNDEEIILQFNNSAIYNNNHIAVAGNSGSGKTEFAKYLLRKIVEKSNSKVNFIYLDFKGLKGGDVENMRNFFEATKTDFIDLMSDKFPINPLSTIDSINAKNRQAGIDKLKDIIGKYSNLGTKQLGALREAIHECFTLHKPGEFPTFKEINEQLAASYDKKDTLTEIIDDLSRYEIFDDKGDISQLINRNIYLSLSGDLPAAVRFTSLFLIIHYLYNTFMNMENTEVKNGYRSMRYVILIDEAHVIFREKKYHEILEKIIREIRSKGVSLILLSQGIAEFNQPTFNFSELCQICFLLDIQDKTNSRAIGKFLGLSETETSKTSRSLEKIAKGQAISNLKNLRGEVLDLKQDFKDK